MNIQIVPVQWNDQELVLKKEADLILAKKDKEIALLRKQRSGLHCFASALTEVKSEEKLDIEITQALSDLDKKGG